MVVIRGYQPVKDLQIFRSPQKLVQVLVQRPVVKKCISKSLEVKEVDVASEKDPMIQISRLRLRNVENIYTACIESHLSIISLLFSRENNLNQSHSFSNVI